MYEITKSDYFLRRKTKVNIRGESMVGVLMERSPALITVLYSCYMKGITYVPLDPEWPLERINNIIERTELKVIIVTNKTEKNLRHVQIITVDKDDYIEIETNALAQKIAYVIFTSGSTGEPKGVKVRKTSLLAFIKGVGKIIDFSSGKKMACFTTVSFDIFFLESIMALEKNLTVVLADENEQCNPKAMADLIRNNKIDMLQMTPSNMQLLINYDRELTSLKLVKEIMIGGEPFSLKLLHILQAKTKAKIFNMYGPTETTIWSSISDLTYSDKIDIGKPIEGTEIYIINENGKLVSDNEIGEICIAGDGIAEGYWKNEKETTARFVYLPELSNIRIYKTGDLGRYLQDGHLECIGRVDNQVKIRGHRIEVEEIEAVINKFDGILQSIVVPTEIGMSESELVSFYTADKEIDDSMLKKFLSTYLPSYMIPVKSQRIRAFKYTSNGKIDRKNVWNCEIINTYTTDYDARKESTNSTYNEILEIVRQNLPEIDENLISMDTDFNSIGINSITFVKIIVEIENHFGILFEGMDLLVSKYQKVHDLAEYVELILKK